MASVRTRDVEQALADAPDSRSAVELALSLLDGVSIPAGARRGLDAVPEPAPPATRPNARRGSTRIGTTLRRAAMGLRR